MAEKKPVGFTRVVFGDKQILIPQDIYDRGVSSRKKYIVDSGQVTWQELQEAGFSDREQTVGGTAAQVGDWTLDNLDVVGPAVAGVAVSKATGGIAAPIAASALTAAATKYYVDTQRRGKEPSLETGLEALEAGGESVLIDVGTLGIAKIGLPMLRMMGFSSDEASKLVAAANKREALPVGSEESLLQTQNLLVGSKIKDAGLSATQTGKASRFKEAFEGVTDTSPFAGGRATARQEANTEAIKAEFLDLIRQESLTDVGRAELGQNILDVIVAGKKALSTNYTNALEPWLIKHGDVQVEPTLITKALSDVKNQMGYSATVKKPVPARVPETMSPGRTTPQVLATPANTQQIGTEFQQEALDMVNQRLSELKDVKFIPVKSLLAMQRTLNNAIDQAGSFGVQNRTLEAQLTKASNAFRNAIEETVRIKDPRGYDSLKEINRNYASGIESLIPPLDKAAVESAGEGYYEAIGKLLIGNPQATKVKAIQDSLNRAFAESRKAGVNPKDLPLKNSDQAFQAIKNGYVRGMLPDLRAETFNPAQYRDLARQFEDPTMVEVHKQLFGKDYGRFKTVINALSDATNKPDTIIGALQVQGKQASAMQRVGTSALGLAGAMGTGAAVGGPIGTMAAALTWMLSPSVFQRIISNQKAVNKMLVLQAESGKVKMTPTFMMSGLGKVYNTLSDEDKAFIQNQISEEVYGALKTVNSFQALDVPPEERRMMQMLSQPM